MVAFLSVLQYLVLTLWVGAMFGFGILYAPVLYRSLPSREQAASIADDTLARIDSVGLVTAGILLVVTILQAIDSHWRSIDLGRVLLTVVMLGILLLNTITVRQRLSGLRPQTGHFSGGTAEDEPASKEYNKYHRLSRGLFSLNTLLGVILIALSALR